MKKGSILRFIARFVICIALVFVIVLGNAIGKNFNGIVEAIFSFPPHDLFLIVLGTFIGGALCPFIYNRILGCFKKNRNRSSRDN